MSEDRPAAPSPWRCSCADCLALCCVAPSLKPANGFPGEKPAGAPCLHLEAGTCRCRIFDGFARHGNTLCRGYDCFGAGQLVTAVMRRAGVDWRGDPTAAAPHFADFLRLWRLHLLIAALDQGVARDEPLKAALVAISQGYAETGRLPPLAETDALLARHRASVTAILARAGYQG
jgi:hypothetical protein